MYWLRGKHRIAEHSAESSHLAELSATAVAAEVPQPMAAAREGAHSSPTEQEMWLTEATTETLPASDQTLPVAADESDREATETYEVIVTYEESAVLELPLPEPAGVLLQPAPAADRTTRAESQPQAESQPAVKPSKDHDHLYARNWAFIEPDLQNRLANTTLFAAGTGLGSLVSTLAVRTGFTHFILADGDQVENTNLNRQAFERGQLGQNKAISTAEQIRRIQPQAAIEIIPRFVDETDFPALIARSDLIVNTIDFSSPAFLALNRLAGTAGKTVLFPFNLGWGGALLVFTPESATLDEFADIDPHAPFSVDFVTRLILRVIERVPGGPPPYFQELMARYAARTPDSWPYDPQLGVGAHITASLVVQAAVSLVAGWPLRTAPDIAWCDARAAMSASTLLAPPSP